MTILGLLAVLLPMQRAPDVPAYWGSLTPGRYAVGFRQQWVIDSTRRLPPGRVPGPAFRPVLMNVWYPSSVRAGPRMRYRDYFDGAERSAASVPKLSAYARALVRFELGLVTREIMRAPDPDSLSPDRRQVFDRFLDAPTAARRGASMARGSFPIVVYFQGSQSTYDDNVALCEYLASRGYVVLGGAYPAEDNQDFATSVTDRSRERDARRLLVEARRLPDVDPARVTVIGHSAGAQAALLFSSDPSAPVDAVLALDTTQDYWTLADRRFAYFTDPVLERRREIRTPTVFFAEPRAMYERLVAADTAYRRVFRYMTSLGRYWDQVGDRPQALGWWRMAATLDPSDSVATRRSQPDRD